MSRVAQIATAAVALLPSVAAAFDPVEEREEFEALIVGRELRIGVIGLSITVVPDGTITGDAGGWPITGSWQWQDGLFCREMDWGGMAIPYNCQSVEVRPDDAVRFTVDGGAGDSATFNIR